MVTTDTADARERILSTAYDLFARRGIQNVGVDELMRQAGVAKATFYRHFPSKDALALAFLERRATRWLHEHVETETRRRASTPKGRLLAVFDVFDDWFHREDFEAGTFAKVLLEMGPKHPLGQASIHYLATTRTMVESLAEQAGLSDPAQFARSMHILLEGSIISAVGGDPDSAHLAQQMAAHLIEDHQR